MSKPDLESAFNAFALHGQHYALCKHINGQHYALFKDINSKNYEPYKDINGQNYALCEWSALGTTNYANSPLISLKALYTIHQVAVLDKNAKLKCKKNETSLKVLQLLLQSLQCLKTALC